MADKQPRLKVQVSVASSALNVLLLEDEPLICMDVETILETEGFDVSSAMSCREANSSLDQYRPDIVIIDIGLRDGASTHVAHRILGAGIPLIIYTGEHRSFHVGTPFDRGIWVGKPAARQELLQAVSDTIVAHLPLHRYA